MRTNAPSPHSGHKAVLFEQETTWLRNTGEDRKSKISDTAWIRNSFRKRKNVSPRNKRRPLPTVDGKVKVSEKVLSPDLLGNHHDALAIVDEIDGTLEDSLTLNYDIPAQTSDRNKSVSFSCGTETTWLRNSNHDRKSICDTAWIRNSFRKKKTKKRDVSPDSSLNRSAFTTRNLLDNGERSRSRSPSRGRKSRVAKMKAKFQDSFKTSEDMDASWGRSWGGALSLEDFSLSSSEDSDEDSLGDFGMGASVNFRTKAQQSMSFNMSFVQIGLDEPANSMDNSRARASSPKPSKRAGRGSIFLIADEKFAQTKVVQSRLEKAAKKLQRFFRRCLLVLRQYSDEMEYLRSEFADIESRRVEELADVQTFLEEEKEQFRMEMEQEWNANKLAPEAWEAFQKETDDIKEEIVVVRLENEQLKKDCKELQHKNNQLSIGDPEQEAEIRRLEKEVKNLELDSTECSNFKHMYQTMVEEAARDLAEVAEKRKVKRDHRKRIQKSIAKIIKLMEGSNETEENTKLVEKVKKLKAKREKKMKKLKFKTAQEAQIPTFIQIDPEQEEEGQKKQRKEKRKGSKSKKGRRSKKLSENDTPSLDPATDADEKVARKDKNKTKEKKGKKKDTSLTTMVDDSALKMIYEAEQKKTKTLDDREQLPKTTEKVTDETDDEPVEPGALMAIILGSA